MSAADVAVKLGGTVVDVFCTPVDRVDALGQSADQKPPPIVIAVDGAAQERPMGSSAMASLHADPHFQNYAILVKGLNREHVMDAAKLAIEYIGDRVQAFSQSNQAQKIDELLAGFAKWKVAKGIKD